MSRIGYKLDVNEKKKKEWLALITIIKSPSNCRGKKQQRTMCKQEQTESHKDNKFDLALPHATSNKEVIMHHSHRHDRTDEQLALLLFCLPDNASPRRNCRSEQGASARKSLCFRALVVALQTNGYG